MIQQLRVQELWGRENFNFDFHPDLNILTGSNGSGKTTLLKLLWYMVSGHARLAIEEISFSGADTLVQKKGNSHAYEVSFAKTSAESPDFTKPEPVVYGENLFSIIYKIHQSAYFTQQIVNHKDLSRSEMQQKVGAEIPSPPITTVFFPTFRRFEGGFSMGQNGEGEKVIEGLQEFSKRMTHGEGRHRFVAYANDEDVRGLINEISSDIRVRMQPIEEEFMNFVKTAANTSDFAQQVKARIADKERKEAQIKAPLDKLSYYIDHFFLEKSVEVSEVLVLGSHANRVKLAQLSAGEKNLLSFLVYAMSGPDAMFIDEPELDLHTDWQRLLLGVLREIAPQTQFFVATHASAIRAAYPEKQFFLDDQLVEA
ncbi:MAG: ATP-binding protein [Bernardetiaceae bacterium]|jgi:ABC-type lipoprotein export system ATPase subunit|nr:ATP-binding protein [Bernardetiaceae bacterium]